MILGKFFKKYLRSLILVTHNYASSRDSLEGFRIPDLPERVYQLEDGDAIEIDDFGEIKIIMKEEKFVNF